MNTIFQSPKRTPEQGNVSSQSPLSPRKYFSRKFKSNISWHELPLEKDAQGINTPAGIFFLLMRLTVPLAYIYIFLIITRELCGINNDDTIDNINDNINGNALYKFLQTYMKPFATIINKMQKSSKIVEIWVFIEAIFYIIQVLHIRYLQYKDPLEASLNAAPIATLSERKKLMEQIMNQIMYDDPIMFIRGWFFDKPLVDITRYDVLDFFAWCMFEGRNQEHLTEGEVIQLNWFVKELECRIGVFMYGCSEEDEDDDRTGNNGDNNNHYKNKGEEKVHFEERQKNEYDNGTSQEKRSYYIKPREESNHDNDDVNNYNPNEDDDFVNDTNLDFGLDIPILPQQQQSKSKSQSKQIKNKQKHNHDHQKHHHLKPKKEFHFPETTHDASPGYFTNLFENYNSRYQQYKQNMDYSTTTTNNDDANNTADNTQTHTHPHIHLHDNLQNIRNFVANTRQQFVEVEEHVMDAASNMYEHAYFTFIDKGSSIDKRMSAISNATHSQLNDAWNSVHKMKERIETAQFLTKSKKALQQQHKGYKALLERSIQVHESSTSVSVPPRQLVDLMKKITQCNESLEMIEDSAMDSFLKVTGFAKKHLLQQKEPQRYAKYTEDELLGLAIYPLAFNLAILGLTDGLLRILMSRRGFERLNIGTTVYYFHPGQTKSQSDDDDNHDGSDHVDNDNHEDREEDHHLTPIVFCHGIGIGLGYYLSLIDELLKLGRPLLLPEIPYVCGFRPWISRKSILTPPAVVSTLTAMLASHGYMKASFIGHSYGTSWVSYMCKYSKDTMASVMFLDPICFCLHHPCLTKSFVYHRADPGSISYMVKTDVIINWTIQRSFPWARIILFVEDIPDIPCSVYISEHDSLIPVETVEKYFKSKNAHFCDEKDTTDDHFKKGPINVSIFRGEAHGDWTESPSTAIRIARTARLLTEEYESRSTT